MTLVKNWLRRVGFQGNSKKRRGSASRWLEIIEGPLQGYYMQLDLNSPAFWHKEMMDGCYDSFIYDALGEVTSIEGATVWDVGAHIGYHSLTFAVLVGPSGHVVAFEPNPYNADRLRRHVERNKELGECITLMTCALSNVDGEETFVLSSEVDDGRSSGSHLSRALVPEEQKAYQSFSQTTVSVVRADSLLREQRIPAPSIIKVDVEGAEALVLEGARQILSNLKPILLIEVHHIVAMHDTLNILLGLGYHTTIVNGAPASPSRCFLIAHSL